MYKLKSDGRLVNAYTIMPIHVHEVLSFHAYQKKYQSDFI